MATPDLIERYQQALAKLELERQRQEDRLHALDPSQLEALEAAAQKLLITERLQGVLTERLADARGEG